MTTICWAALIYHLSTSDFGSSFTERMLGQILSLCRLHVSPATLDLLNFLLRKLAHLTEYAIFGQLLYVSLLSADGFEWRPPRALVAVLAAGFYSLTDEFHQSFVPNRTASLVDCAIDTTGAILGLLALYLVGRLLQAKRRRRAAKEASAAET